MKDVVKFCTVFILILQSVLNCQTIISGGIINSDTTWGLSGSPYVIENGLSISNTGVLHISAGTVIKFSAGGAYMNTMMNVYGILDAQGTANNRVVFTSIYDDSYGGDTNGDGTSTSAGRGQFGGIAIYNSNNDIENCLIRCGGNFVTTNKSALSIINCTAKVKNCTIEESAGYGIIISGLTENYTLDSDTVRDCDQDGININTINADLTLSNNTVSNCSWDGIGLYGDINNFDCNVINNKVQLCGQVGIHISGGRSYNVNNNDIISNSFYGLKNENNFTINAENNYWGDPSGPYHPTLNPAGKGNAVSDNVEFIPFSFQMQPKEISFISAKIIDEHSELKDGKISPGENFKVAIKLKNNTNKSLTIQNVLPTTDNNDLVFSQDIFGQLPQNINANSTIDYSPVTIKILNWPSKSIANIKFKISVSDFLNIGANREITCSESYELNIFKPESDKTFSIPKLQIAVANKTIKYGDIITTEYLPFSKIDHCEGCDGLQASGLITDLFTGLLLNTFKSVISDEEIMKRLKSKALDYVLNKILNDENKYRYIYTVAGINHVNTSNKFSNFFHTDSPDLWDIPEINKPVKVIAIIKNFDENSTSIFGNNDNISLPILEPLVFIENNNIDNNSIYLSTVNYRPKDGLITQDGVVHQTWKDPNNEIYYFTIVTIKDDPAGDIPIIGSLLNVFYDREVIRTICKVTNFNQLPEIGSTVRVKGSYQYVGANLADQVPTPSNWTGGHPQKWYVDVNNINIIAGENAKADDLEKEFFNSDVTRGNI